MECVYIHSKPYQMKLLGTEVYQFITAYFQIYVPYFLWEFFVDLLCREIVFYRNDQLKAE